VRTGKEKVKKGTVHVRPGEIVAEEGEGASKKVGGKKKGEKPHKKKGRARSIAQKRKKRPSPGLGKGKARAKRKKEGRVLRHCQYKSRRSFPEEGIFRTADSTRYKGGKARVAKGRRTVNPVCAPDEGRKEEKKKEGRRKR